jgi:hypothetical protein
MDILSGYDDSEIGGMDFSAPSAPSSGVSSMDIKGLGMLGSAYGTYMQGIQQKKAYDYNAELVRQSGVMDQYQLGREEVALLSSARAMTAKAGVTQSGSPLDAALASASGFELDKQIAKYNTESKANMMDWEGRQAKKQAQSQALMQGIEGIAMLALL